MKKLIFVFVALFCMMSCSEQKSNSVVNTTDTVVIDTVDSVVDSVEV